MGFALRDDIGFCIAAERTIFLDLRAGRYHALPTSQFEAFQRWASGSASTAEDAGKLEHLVRQGILTTADQDVKPTSSLPVVTHSPEIAFKTHQLPTLAAIVLAIASRILWASRLKRWPLTRQFQHLRTLAGASEEDSARSPSGTFASIVRAFEIADILLGSHDRCLERSLALAATCRKRGFATMVVIGVQTNPFSAHCWVQNESVVLNDQPDRVQMFTPILVV
jgi:hypothetical protein